MSDSENDNKGEVRQHLAPYPTSRLAPSFELVDLAAEIAKADDMLTMQTNGKLEVLAKQIRTLQEEARQILLETRRNQELHRAECAFGKKAGQVYHAYRKENGAFVLSLLSPAEWGDRQPFPFEGSYRLENDMSWTRVGEEEE